MGSGKVSALEWVALALSAAALYICWPLWPALVLAAWIAALARPLLARFERGLNGRRRAAAALVLLLFLLLLIPLVLVGLGVASGAQELWHAIAQTSSAKSALEAIAAGTAATPAPELPTSLPAALDLLERYGAQGLDVLTRLAGAAAKGLVGLFIFFAGAFVVLLDGPRAWAWVERHSPLGPHPLSRLAAAFQETGRGLIIGVGLTMVAQALVATLIYLSLGVPRWWVLGPITGLSAIIPLIGSALVWGPITLGLFLTGHPIKGVILLVVGAGVISTVDNVLRPVFSRLGALRLPTFLVFVSVFGGIAAVGPWGALLGPLVLRLWVEAVVMYREGRLQGRRPQAMRRPAMTRTSTDTTASVR